MKAKLTVSCFFMSALLLIPVAGFAADTTTASTQQYVKDSVITTKIKAELAEKNPSSMMHIQVATDKNGVVWLSGTAASQADIDMAGSIASSVDGVISVQNKILIDPARHTGAITKTTRADPVEAHIKAVHAKLKITPAEESQWLKVAQMMRDSAHQMDTLTKTSAEKTNMNAIDSLKSYSEIADAHASNIKKFIPVFETLYDSMPDAQKKNADALFREHGHTNSKHSKSEQPS